MSSERPVPFQDVFDSKHLFQRRLGHITSISIRNLTPFPARDALTSALSKPAELPNATHGHLPDDIDATLAHRRSRRISTNSIATLRSLRSDDGVGENAGMGEGVSGDGRGRRRTGSKVSDKSTKSTSVGRTAPTIRPQQRVRTTSVASVFTTAQISGSDTNAELTRVQFSTQDYSQLGLEKVISSRLVETFLAVTSTSPAESEAPVASPPATPSSPRNGFPTSPRKDGFPVPSSPSPSSLDKSRRRDSWTSSRGSSSTSGHVRSSSFAARSKGTSKTAATSPLASSSTFPSTSSSAPPAEPQSSVPDYLSPIHQPSTNSCFSFEPKSEFAPWTNFSAEKLKVELWAKVRSERKEGNGKGKEKEHASTGKSVEWQILEQWNLDLNELIPLQNPNSEDETTAPPPQLPSNTLLVTLNPPGMTFYALAPSSSRSPRARSASPATGYASDPESNLQKAKDSEAHLDLPAYLSRRRHRRGRQESGKDEEIAKTASWQDLFKLVTIWSCIQDDEKSLRSIVRGLDNIILNDETLPLKREISERECRIAELRRDCASVSAQSQELRDEIRLRRERLRERQNMLALVEQQDQDEVLEREEVREDLVDERSRLASLRSAFTPTRTTLISTLSYIFPIELRSSPDLLFTILDVPLPIPLSQNEPAPPLSLPAHNDVNEETVATALGYVALVVHLLAAYLGQGLVYPITYIGSRSLIRDGISAMVGPRMFPLFSKGVDTYRFEYGVFLLNKDIEMLMAEYDLRAMDIRHTLPNLKNLLLTLSDGEGVPVGPLRQTGSPLSSVSGLASPKLGSPNSTQETLSGGTATPKASDVVDLPTETSPPASGSTTPTNVSMDTPKKTSRFLGLAPSFSGFLRVRYPSSLLSRTVDGPAAENGETPGASASASDEANSVDGDGEAHLRDLSAPNEASGKVADGDVDRSGEATDEAGAQTIRAKGRQGGKTAFTDGHLSAEGEVGTGTQSPGEKHPKSNGIVTHPSATAAFRSS